MSLFNRISIALFIFSIACLSNTYSQPFSDFKHPIAPGQRNATSMVELNGLNKNQVKVSIVYSTDSLAVVSVFKTQNRNTKKYYETNATLGNVVNGKVAANVIFPHKDNLADSKGKVYNAGTKIFYAWKRANTPSGAREELILNSPIKSFVMPRPLTIAYMGDSYASGEGAPDGFHTRNSDAVWLLSELCHRSNRSGGMLAIKRLINFNKELEIDFVNTTCSGATLLDFFMKDQDKSDVGMSFQKNKIQLEQVEDWMRSNNYDGIDIILSDGGGNDIGFGPIATEGLTAFFADISNNEIMKNDIERQLNLLAETYSAYMDKLNSTIDVGRIVWFNYPNPTKDKNGFLCTSDATRYGFCWGPLEMQISNRDWNYIANDVFVELNEKVENAANTHGWDFVDISNRSNQNGLCNCDEGYFNTFGSSQDIQGDEYGTLHPNPIGFKEIYEIPLYNQLVESINIFQKDYIIDIKKRLIEAAKKRAKSEIAWKAKIARMTQLVKDNKMKIKNKPIINPKIKK